MYDDPPREMWKYLRKPAVLQPALGGDMSIYRSHWEFDVRFQSTWQTADTMDEMKFGDEDMGEVFGVVYDPPQRFWILYEDIKPIKF